MAGWLDEDVKVMLAGNTGQIFSRVVGESWTVSTEEGPSLSAAVMSAGAAVENCSGLQWTAVAVTSDNEMI